VWSFGRNVDEIQILAVDSAVGIRRFFRECVWSSDRFDYRSRFGYHSGENPRRECRGDQYRHGVKTTNISNDTGVYNFPNLAVGPYQLEATLTGFRPERVANIDLRSNQTLRYNLTMDDFGCRHCSRGHDRRAGTPGVSSSSVGQALSQDQVSALPLIGGDVLDLSTLFPDSVWRRGPRSQ
jgi:hypothetical protein